MKIKKCTNCGKHEFYIQEVIFHEAYLSSDDNQLTVYKNRTCEIEKIFCKKCETEYKESDFARINF